jgi:peptidoglycan/LPS O-acetylase OafA/YrhL
LKTRSLGVLDQVFGESFDVLWNNKRLHFRGVDFGVIREIYGHCCYVSKGQLIDARNILDLGANASRFLLPFIAVAGIIFLLHEDSKIVIFTPLKQLGKISYSLYLFHPIALLIGTFLTLSQTLHFLVIVSIAIVMAMFSYKYVELPTNRFGYRIANKSVPD